MSRTLRRWTLVALTVMALGTGRAHATPAETQLREGQAKLLEGHFAEAIRHLDVAARLTYSREMLARIHLLRAQCFAATGDARGVDDALRQALQADPEARLDPKKILPALVNRLETLRARLHGTLDLDVEPSTAQVSLDGHALDSNRFRGELPVGPHDIEASAEASTSLKRTVVIRPDEVQTVHLTLVATAVEPAPTVVVNPAPAPAPVPVASSLAIEGSVRGYAPLAGGAGVEGNVGVQGKLWRAELGMLGGRSLGFTLRAGVDARDLLGPVGVFADAEGVLLLNPSNAGVGGEVGISVHPISVLEVFLSANYVRLLGRANDVPDNVLLGGGVRGWLPLLK